MDQIAPLLGGMFDQIDKQTAELNRLNAQMGELQRENQELKTLVIAVSR